MGGVTLQAKWLWEEACKHRVRNSITRTVWWVRNPNGECNLSNKDRLEQWLATRRKGGWVGEGSGEIEGQLCALPLHKCPSQARGYRMSRMGKALYKAILSLDYCTGQSFNYYNDQFLMGKPLSLYFCKVMR